MFVIFSCSKDRRTCLVDRQAVCLGDITCRDIDFCNIGCPNFYRCRNNECTPRSTVCDGNPCSGCDEDDGWTSGVGFQCFRNGERCKIPQQLLWDEVQDCDQGEDLCYILPSSVKPSFDGRYGEKRSQ